MFLRLLQYVLAGVSDVSEIRAASIFRINPENWGGLYLRNIIISHNHTVQQHKHRINLNN